ncbi:MAG: DNA/RNA non-specific endonuclease [Bacteroidales bacterium]|nr:DNA/RNA non-specific endonuclease [Bacteroidales bacterium]
MGRMDHLDNIGKIGRIGILFLCLLLFVPSCRQASSQETIYGSNSSAANGAEKSDPRLWSKNVGLPQIADSIAQQLLWRKAYVVSYNSDTRQPNWVAWKLTAEHADGNIQRPATAWHDDKEVPQPRAYYQDYKGLSDKGKRWDRGHLCPAGDNKWDSVAMYESFLMTNACPQDKALNSGMWNQIEMQCRQWAKQYGEIYIVCGPLFLNQEHDTVGRNRIVVPEAFFKVIMCLDKEHPWGVGYICRNNEGFRKRDLYENTISEIERITGITFFPELSSEISAKVKNTTNNNSQN